MPKIRHGVRNGALAFAASTATGAVAFACKDNVGLVALFTFALSVVFGLLSAVQFEE